MFCKQCIRCIRCFKCDGYKSTMHWHMYFKFLSIGSKYFTNKNLPFPIAALLMHHSLAVHLTPAATCHSFSMSHNVLLQLLNDIRKSWPSSQSEECYFHLLLVCNASAAWPCSYELLSEGLIIEATWHIYPSARKARIRFSLTSLCNCFGMRPRI